MQHFAFDSSNRIKIIKTAFLQYACSIFGRLIYAQVCLFMTVNGCYSSFDTNVARITVKTRRSTRSTEKKCSFQLLPNDCRGLFFCSFKKIRALDCS